MARNYGGAFDIDPEMYFTREEINEFAYDVCDEVADMFPEYDFDVSEVYIDNETGNDMLVIELCADFDYYLEFAQTIDYRKIQEPSDLNKYKSAFVNEFVNEFSEILYG